MRRLVVSRARKKVKGSILKKKVSFFLLKKGEVFVVSCTVGVGVLKKGVVHTWRCLVGW